MRLLSARLRKRDRRAHPRASSGRGRGRVKLARLMLISVACVALAACANTRLPKGAQELQSEQLQVGDGSLGSSGGLAGPSGSTFNATTGTTVLSGATSLAGSGGSANTGARGGSSSATASGGGGSAIGVTKTSITISVSNPFSGVYGAILGKPYNNGFLTWVDQVNASGGIYGRKINVVKADNQLTADGAIAACKQVESSSVFMNMILVSETAEDDCEDAAGIPVFDEAPQQMHTWHQVLVGHDAAAFAPTEVAFLKSHYVNAGSKKIGIIFNGDTQILVASEQQDAAEMKRQGMQLVHVEQVTTNQASFVSEMTRMQASGAQVVVMIVGEEGPGIIRDAHAIGYSPQFIASWSGGTDADTTAKAAGPLFQGVLGLRFWTTTETPAFAAFKAQVQKYQGSATANTVDDLDASYYGTGLRLGKILELAGPNPTRQSFYQAALGIADFDSGVLVPLSFTTKAVAEPSPVGEWSLIPIQCCKADYTWSSLGPPAQNF